MLTCNLLSTERKGLNELTSQIVSLLIASQGPVGWQGAWFCRLLKCWPLPMPRESTIPEVTVEAGLAPASPKVKIEEDLIPGTRKRKRKRKKQVCALSQHVQTFYEGLV